MSGGARIKSHEAAETCRRFLTLLEGTTERLIVAGSLRRRLPTCGDIEIVAIPKLTTAESVTPGLFESVVEVSEVDVLHERLSELLAEGVVQKRMLGADGQTFWGPKTKYLVFEDRPIDLFSTTADLWGWTLVLRTGPAEFSRQIVQPRGLKTKDRRAGLLASHLEVKGGLHSRTSGQLIPTPEEKDVFRVLGIDYRDPWERR